MRNTLKITAGLAFLASVMPFMWPAAPIVFLAAIIALFYTTDSEVERAYKARDEAKKELIELRYKQKIIELNKKDAVLKNEQFYNKLNNIGSDIKTALQELRVSDTSDTDINETNGDSSPFGELVKL